MRLFRKNLAGKAYIALNVIRACNIICLLSAIAASFVMLIKTFVVSKFFFFDGVSHVIEGFIAMGLLITETPLFKRYIANNWPLLSPKSGFVTLGAIMIIVGVSILGNLNKEATSQKSLGTPMWRIVIAAGILTSIFGIVNIFASYLFRSKNPYITAREVRAYGPQAPAKSSPYVTASPSTAKTRRSFHLGRSASDTLPSYHARAGSRNQARNISAPVGNVEGQAGGLGFYSEKDGAIMEGGLNQPPVVGNIQRPDLAHHPAYNNVRPTSSVYTNGDQLRNSAWVRG